jgi:hypothetical protein
VRVKLLNMQDSSYDGGTWDLYPVELVDDDGKTVATDKDDDFYEKLAELKVIENRHQRSVCYYNDNPSVHGVPAHEVTVGKTTFQCIDLMNSASWNESDAGVLWAEVGNERTPLEAEPEVSKPTGGLNFFAVGEGRRYGPKRPTRK